MSFHKYLIHIPIKLKGIEIVQNSGQPKVGQLQLLNYGNRLKLDIGLELEQSYLICFRFILNQHLQED